MGILRRLNESRGPGCALCKLKDPQLRYQHFLRDFLTLDELSDHLRATITDPLIFSGILDWRRMRDEAGSPPH